MRVNRPPALMFNRGPPVRSGKDFVLPDVPILDSPTWSEDSDDARKNNRRMPPGPPGMMMMPAMMQMQMMNQGIAARMMGARMPPGGNRGPPAQQQAQQQAQAANFTRIQPAPPPGGRQVADKIMGLPGPQQQRSPPGAYPQSSAQEPVRRGRLTSPPQVAAAGGSSKPSSPPQHVRFSKAGDDEPRMPLRKDEHGSLIHARGGGRGGSVDYDHDDGASYAPSIMRRNGAGADRGHSRRSRHEDDVRDYGDDDDDYDDEGSYSSGSGSDYDEEYDDDDSDSGDENYYEEGSYDGRTAGSFRMESLAAPSVIHGGAYSHHPRGRQASGYSFAPNRARAEESVPGSFFHPSAIHGGRRGTRPSVMESHADYDFAAMSIAGAERDSYDIEELCGDTNGGASAEYDMPFVPMPTVRRQSSDAQEYSAYDSHSDDHTDHTPSQHKRGQRYSMGRPSINNESLFGPITFGVARIGDTVDDAGEDSSSKKQQETSPSRAHSPPEARSSINGYSIIGSGLTQGHRRKSSRGATSRLSRRQSRRPSRQRSRRSSRRRSDDDFEREQQERFAHSVASRTTLTDDNYDYFLSVPSYPTSAVRNTRLTSRDERGGGGDEYMDLYDLDGGYDFMTAMSVNTVEIDPVPKRPFALQSPKDSSAAGANGSTNPQDFRNRITRNTASATRRRSSNNADSTEGPNTSSPPAPFPMKPGGDSGAGVSQFLSQYDMDFNTVNQSTATTTAATGTAERDRAPAARTANGTTTTTATVSTEGNRENDEVIPASVNSRVPLTRADNLARLYKRQPASGDKELSPSKQRVGAASPRSRGAGKSGPKPSTKPGTTIAVVPDTETSAQSTPDTASRVASPQGQYNGGGSGPASPLVGGNAHNSANSRTPPPPSSKKKEPEEEEIMGPLRMGRLTAPVEASTSATTRTSQTQDSARKSDSVASPLSSLVSPGRGGGKPENGSTASAPTATAATRHLPAPPPLQSLQLRAPQPSTSSSSGGAGAVSGDGDSNRGEGEGSPKLRGAATFSSRQRHVAATHGQVVVPLSTNSPVIHGRLRASADSNSLRINGTGGDGPSAPPPPPVSTTGTAAASPLRSVIALTTGGVMTVHTVNAPSPTRRGQNGVQGRSNHGYAANGTSAGGKPSRPAPAMEWIGGGYSLLESSSKASPSASMQANSNGGDSSPHHGMLAAHSTVVLVGGRSAGKTVKPTVSPPLVQIAPPPPLSATATTSPSPPPQPHSVSGGRKTVKVGAVNAQIGQVLHSPNGTSLPQLEKQAQRGGGLHYPGDETNGRGNAVLSATESCEKPSFSGINGRKH